MIRMPELLSVDLPTVNWPVYVPVRVIIPDKWDRKDENNQAAIFLLHGLFGNCNNWIELTPLLDLMGDRKYLVITPEAWDSWYVDSYSDPDKRYERFFFDDLVRWADEKFGPLRKRGVAGLSMGGYGAFLYGLKRPDLFDFAYSSSGAFVGPRITAETSGFDELKDSVSTAFSLDVEGNRCENDIFELLTKVESGIKTQFLFDCGAEDSFIEVNRSVANEFKKQKITCSFRELSGEHDWVYWSERLIDILDTADKILTT